MGQANPNVIALHPTPAGLNARLLIYGIRRIASGGLNDAFATSAFFSTFGASYRRPLLLLRALMAELARISQRPITVGPSCCRRMTPGEAALLAVVVDAIARPRLAALRLERLLGVRECLGAIWSAQALAQAFEDLGRPIDAQDLAESVPASPID